MTYKVLIDYGTYEGMKFAGPDEGFEDLNEAVKCGIENSYGSKFLIVTVIDWAATERGCCYYG